MASKTRVQKNIFDNKGSEFGDKIIANDGLIVKNAYGETILNIDGSVPISGGSSLTTNILDTPSSGGTLDLGKTRAGIINIGNGGTTTAINIGDTVVDTLTIKGATFLNTTGTSATSIGNTSSTLTLTGSTVSMDTVAAGTINIGNTNATTINIGNATAATPVQTINIGSNGTANSIINIGSTGDTITITGTVTTVGTSSLTVSNKFVQLNDGAVGSGTARNAGIFIRDNGNDSQSYFRTDPTLGTKIQFKAPENTGVVEIAPVSGATSTVVITDGDQTINGIKTFADTTNGTSSTVASHIISGSIGVANNLIIGSSSTSKAFAGLATGSRFRIDNGTVTDASSSGTVASTAVSSLAATPLAASVATTYTDAYTLYIAGPPSASTNVTLSSPYALYIATGKTRLGGDVTIANASGASVLTLDASANNTSITSLTDVDPNFSTWLKNALTGTAEIQISPRPQDGTSISLIDLWSDVITTGTRLIRFYGPSNAVIGEFIRTTSNPFLTLRGGSSGTNLRISGASTAPGGLTLRANDTDTTGTVSVTTDTASTSSTTGAFLVSGGVGITKDLNLGASIQRTSQEFATYDATTTPLSADNNPIPIAQIQQGTAVITPTAAHTKATPSASALITGLAFTDATARPTNTQYIWTVNNLADTSSNNLTFTLSAGTSVTIPSGQNMTIGAGRSGSFLFTITGASTVTVRRLNDSTEGFTSNAPVAISQVLETIAPEVLADDTTAIPVSAIQAGHMTITPTVSRTKALPTATAILTAFASSSGAYPQVGRRISFRITNKATNWYEGFRLTMTAGTGITATNFANLIVSPASTAEFIFEVTNIVTPALTLYRNGLPGGSSGYAWWQGDLWIHTGSSTAFGVRGSGNGILFNCDNTSNIVTVGKNDATNPATFRVDGGAFGTHFFEITDNAATNLSILTKTGGTTSATIRIVPVPAAGANTGTIEFFNTSSGAGTTNQWDIYDNTTLVARLSRAVGGSTDAPVTFSGKGTIGILNIYGSDTSGKNLILGANSADLSTGQINILTTTDSSSTTTGSLTTAGGAGIAKSLKVGGNVVLASDSTTAPDLIIKAGSTLPNDPGDIIWRNNDATERARVHSGTGASPSIDITVGTSATLYHSISATNNLFLEGNNLTARASSASANTPGALVFQTNAAVQKAKIHAGTTSSNELFLQTSTTDRVQIDSTGDTHILSTTDSSSISTGSLQVLGGVGITKNLYVGGTFNATGGVTFSGDLTITGDVIGSGGTTISGGTTASNNLILQSTSHATKGQVQIPDNTVSTSTTTGSLVITGGVGISRDLNVNASIQRASQEFATYDLAANTLAADSVALTTANLQQSVVTITPTAAHTKATPTATAIIDAFPFNGTATRRQNNTNYIWTVCNLASPSSAGRTFTLSAGTDVTIPSGQNMTVGAGRSGQFLFSFTDTVTPAVKVLRLNDSTEGFTSNAPVTLFSSSADTFRIVRVNGSDIPFEVDNSDLTTYIRGVSASGPANLVIDGNGNNSNFTRIRDTESTLSEFIKDGSTTATIKIRSIAATSTGVIQINPEAIAGQEAHIELFRDQPVTGVFQKLQMYDQGTRVFSIDRTSGGGAGAAVSIGAFTSTAALFITGSSNASGDLTLRSTSDATKGRVFLDETTQSTTTTTGTLVTSGGVGIAKNLFIGGTLNATGATTLSSTLNVTSTTTLTSTLVMNSTGSFIELGDTTGAASTPYIDFHTGGSTSIYNDYHARIFGVSGSGNATIGSGRITIQGRVRIDGPNGDPGGTTYRTADAPSAEGIKFHIAPTTLTNDSTTTATITLGVISGIGTSTLAASAGALTYTEATSLYIAGAPATGSFAAITESYALMIGAGRTYIKDATSSTSTTTGALRIAGGVGIGHNLNVSNKVGIGESTSGSQMLLIGTTTASPTPAERILLIIGSVTNTASAPGLSGIQCGQNVFTLTTSGSHTVVASQWLQSPTTVTGSSSTVTNYATLYIQAAPPAPTSTTVTNGPHALLIGSGTSRTLDTTDSTSTSSGSLTTAGGVGIAKQLTVGTNLVVNGTTFSSYMTVTPLSDANATLTATQTINGLVSMTNTSSARTITTPSATTIIAAIPGYATSSPSGNTFTLYVRNTSTTLAELTVVGGTSVTVDGTAIVASGITRTFLGVITSATTITLYSMGASAH